MCSLRKDFNLAYYTQRWNIKKNAIFKVPTEKIIKCKFLKFKYSFYIKWNWNIKP